jgi:hypothetical protein
MNNEAYDSMVTYDPTMDNQELKEEEAWRIATEMPLKELAEWADETLGYCQGIPDVFSELSKKHSDLLDAVLQSRMEHELEKM